GEHHRHGTGGGRPPRIRCSGVSGSSERIGSAPAGSPSTTSASARHSTRPPSTAATTVSPVAAPGTVPAARWVAISGPGSSARPASPNAGPPPAVRGRPRRRPPAAAARRTRPRRARATTAGPAAAVRRHRPQPASAAGPNRRSSSPRTPLGVTAPRPGAGHRTAGGLLEDGGVAGEGPDDHVLADPVVTVSVQRSRRGAGEVVGDAERHEDAGGLLHGGPAVAVAVRHGEGRLQEGPRDLAEPVGVVAQSLQRAVDEFLAGDALVAVAVRDSGHALPERLRAAVEGLSPVGTGRDAELRQQRLRRVAEVLAVDVAVAVLVERGESVRDPAVVLAGDHVSFRPP